MREVDFLLVGGGMASAYCASELRRQGADGSVLLVGREKDPPYERPPLSKEYLRGEAERADAVVNGVEWYEENDVELLSGKSVMSLDAGERVAKIQGGEEVRFGKALLGHRRDGEHPARRWRGAGRDPLPARVRQLGLDSRGREGAEKRAVLIGGSYIGCEVAASLTEMGVKCTIVMLEDVALSTGFGEEAGRFFQGVLESKGVEFVGGASLGLVRGRRARSEGRDRGRARDRVRLLRGGRRGAARRDARAARRARGRRRDRLRLAVADFGRRDLRGGRLLLVRQRGARAPASGRALGRGAPAGEACGKAMLGSDEPYRAIPYFFSDLSDWTGLEYVGPAKDWDEVVFRGSMDDGEFSAWYLKDGAVAGALAVGPLRGPRARASADRNGRERGGPKGRAGRRGFGPRGRRRLGLFRAIVACPVGDWCNGSTRSSGRVSRGSNP